MKYYDNSRAGNDCWIQEHWYWHDECDGYVIVVRKYDSDFEPPQLFTGVNPTMPEQVLSWFRDSTM